MKILIYSPFFYPSIGGLETVVSILAHEFVAQAHEVKLVSQIPAKDDTAFPFEVIRRPDAGKLLQLMRWCDLFFQPSISLKGIWPLMLQPKPWVVSHNNWYRRDNDRLSWQDYLKHFCIRFATNISVSHAIAAHIAPPSTVIPNPYQDDLFKVCTDVPRDRDLVFLGRLVSAKGVDLLLHALADLKTAGLTPNLTVIGQGPEESALEQLANSLGIAPQVEFVGAKVGQDLVRLLNAHQIMVVPSRWQEPFGIVALEGIACGCVVVGSAGGGLKDSIGPCGVTFPNENIAYLTQVLAQLLSYPEQLKAYLEQAKTHLCRHHPAIVAQAYLTVFEEALR